MAPLAARPLACRSGLLAPCSTPRIQLAGCSHRSSPALRPSPSGRAQPPRAAAVDSGPSGEQAAHSGHVQAAQQQQQQQLQQELQQSPQEAELERQRLTRKAARQREQAVYQFSAIAASAGIGALAIAATYYRMHWHHLADESFPWADLGATLLLAFGGMVGMEMYARYAHKLFWHDSWGWALHESHHVPRTGPFEANDFYALVNAVPAMALCAYGFLRPDIIGGVTFGLGLGITLFGIAYMFVHDGLVHKRFPVGPIADVPMLQRMALAHKLHHSEKYGGVPFGMFLGPQELEAVGAGPELEEMMADFQASKAKADAAKAAAGRR